MRVSVQVVIESADALPVTTEIAHIERGQLDAGSFGLHLAEAKSILGGLQRSMVDAQVAAFIAQARVCPSCGVTLRHKGKHDIVQRTVFGKLKLESPRHYRCQCCAGNGRSFSPLAERLAERCSPELQYLETKFSALMSYGLTVKVLGEILPLDQVLAATSIRRRAHRTGERIELRNEQQHHEVLTRFKPEHPYIPEPSPVKAIGIDGGYVRLAGAKSRQEGWFEVIVGKSQREEGRGRCFAYVHRLERDPSQRMQRFVSNEGIRPDQPVTFLSDGADTVRQAQTGFGHMGEYVLDWFHISMRFQNLTQLAKGLEETEDSPKPEDILKDIEGAKWHLWHGSAYRSMERLESLIWDVDAMKAGESKSKLGAKLEEVLSYIDSNRAFIVNYGDRFRHGEPIATGFVESAVNQVVAKRFVKKQQMAWMHKNAHLLLQVRTAVLNEELRTHFERWYPALAANDVTAKLAA
jgi:hypothetical protein